MTKQQREFAIKTIEGLRRINGPTLVDLGTILAMPHRDLQAYLEDEVRRPLDKKLRNASREGYGAISYLIYSAYDRDKELVNLSYESLEPISQEGLPRKIEFALRETERKHIVKPKPIELMLYVKAIDSEPFVFSDELLSREFSLV